MNEFADYCFCSNWDGDGEIYNQENKIVWRFQKPGLEHCPKESLAVTTPVFIFNHANGKELLRINRERKLPLARFVVIEHDMPRCTIRQQSIWFTKYEFEFGHNSKWKLYLLMFNIFGKAVSESGAEILVRARSRRQWFVRMVAGSESPSMMAALAFIIRKKLQCT
jgi:hypothetical protein